MEGKIYFLEFTKEPMNMEKSTVSENSNGQMVQFMKGNSRKTTLKEAGITCGRMAVNTKVNC
jgi:hypothetical protein